MDDITDGRKTMREESVKRALVNRLKRIEGQVGALVAMLEDDAYCPDILLQTSATIAALQSFNRELLARHINTCFVDDIRRGHDEATDELAKLVAKLLK